MSTPSEVKSGLDEISALIRNGRIRLAAAKEMLATQETNLTAIPSRFAAVKAEIDGYTPTGIFEELAQDELAKMTTEYITLRDAATAGVAALLAITEY